MRAKKPAKKDVWQNHHITYFNEAGGVPDWVVRLRRKEHFYITMLQRFKCLSYGSKLAIDYVLRTKPEIKEDDEED